jgi:hypothetical protein
MSEGTRFHISPGLWQTAVDEIYELLVQIARKESRVTYSEVVERLNSVRLEPDSHAFHAMLGDVSRRAFDEGGPLLSAVVVGKETQVPGAGFASLARGLGYKVPEGRDAEAIFGADQLKLVHEWWRKH